MLMKKSLHTARKSKTPPLGRKLESKEDVRRRCQTDVADLKKPKAKFY